MRIDLEKMLVSPAHVVVVLVGMLLAALLATFPVIRRARLAADMFEACTCVAMAS